MCAEKVSWITFRHLFKVPHWRPIGQIKNHSGPNIDLCGTPFHFFVVIITVLCFKYLPKILLNVLLRILIDEILDFSEADKIDKK